jgi:Zn-dependent protease with chaperone function
MLEARFFDGRSSRPHAARLQVRGDTLCVLPAAGDDDNAFAPLSVPLAQVRWPERTRHGGRLAQLPQGASLQASDVAAWDAWMAQQVGARESYVVRAQQNWRGVALAFALLVAAVGAMYQWGLPALATGVTSMVPQRVDAAIGREALVSLDGQLLAPSRLALAEQERIRTAFAQMVQRAHADDDSMPPWRLEFRRGRDRTLGPNALALPGGTIILTDELVELMPGDTDAVLGVLAHEFGHVRLRHGMRQLLQASAVGLAASAAFGDYGTLITAAPVLLATLGYSRAAEREADQDSVRLMRTAGISPRAMVAFFEAMQRWRGTHKERDDDVLGIAFSSHPATAERIAFFRDAAAN